MEIHTLKLSITEADIEAVLSKYPLRDGAVENLQVRLTPEGVQVGGDYPTVLMKVPFETLWEIAGIGRQVQARLATVKVSGLPAGLLRGVLLKTIEDMTARQPGLRVENESIVIDLDREPTCQLLNLRVNLTAVRCETGRAVIEAGPLIV